MVRRVRSAYVDRTKQIHWVLAWPYPIHAAEGPPSPRATLATILWSFPKPKGTEGKYDNALEFFEWYGHEVFPRISVDAKENGA